MTSEKTVIDHQNENTKLLIIGSCVSRDPFEFMPSDDFEIEKYCARLSFASAFADPFSIPADTVLAADWQTKMLLLDSQKTLGNIIASVDWEILLVDLIDERFDIARKGSVLITCSKGFNQAGLQKTRAADSFEIMHIFNDERFDLWCAGWDKLCEIARSVNPAGRIVVNRALWAKDDIVLNSYSPEHVDMQNDALNRMFTYMESKATDGFISFVYYDLDSLSVDLHHKWGPAPFHYTKPTYRYFLKSLRTIAQSTPEDKAKAR